MSERINVITGATGQLGSHIAEQLRAAGQYVRALVRPGSDTTFLQQIGVELALGDLGDAGSVRRAVAGAAVVYHCAARVSDWGPWKTFEEEALTTTRHLVDACQAEKIGRLLHVSSISVYGHPRIEAGQLLDEDTPLGQKIWLWDYYPRAKLRAEQIARTFAGDVTVVRPSWIYGPRDRVTIPRVVPALQQGRVPIIGPGTNLLNIIYAGDVARGAILAAHHDGARGKVYNLCSQGEVTQLALINALTDALSLPRIRKHVPYGLALRFAFLKELGARMLRRRTPPTITRRAIYLIGRSTQFSTARARAELGWRPEVGIQEGVQRALEWYFTLPGKGTFKPAVIAAPGGP